MSNDKMEFKEFKKKFTLRIHNELENILVMNKSSNKILEPMRYSSLNGSKYIRSLLVYATGSALNLEEKFLDQPATAIELIHTYSLVHDDLPCFDNADTGRGKPTVHKAYGESAAVLAGDSLIINAFNCLASASKHSHTRSANLTLCLSKYAGFPNGICAGQGWENESNIDLKSYHMSKTGALFIAATQMGAASAGHDPDPWFELGARIGEAFQVADDLIDVLSDDISSGKSVGQDEKNNRPNAIREFGVEGAKRHLQDILAGAISSIPSCPGEGQLAQLVKMQATKMLEINDSKIIV